MWPQVESGPPGSAAKVRVERVQVQPAGEVDWTVARVDPASRTIEMDWVDGPDPTCGEVNRVQVNERSDAVVVGLSDTARDSAVNCVAVGVPRHFKLRLRAPVGARALLQPVTGVNDGLPHFDSGFPPTPDCSTNSTPSDVPIGMRDAGQHLAPVTATAVVICRIAWPHGAAIATPTRISRTAAVRQLADTLNHAGAQQLQGESAPCGKRGPGAWYAVFFTGPRLQVEVFVDEINCGTVRNGSRAGRVTPAIHQALTAVYPTG